MRGSLRDLRYGIRALRRTPAFTIAAALTLALGIGATSAVFSVLNGVLIKPLAYPDAERLIALEHAALGPNLRGNDQPTMPASLLLTYGDETKALSDLGLWSTGNANVTEIGEPEEVPTLNVTHGTLDALRVHPLVGRWFSEADATVGSPEAVILSYGYWQRRFGADRSIIGRSLMVNARPRTIVGVMPNGFRFLDVDAAIIAPIRLERKQLHLGGFNYHGIARLKPGVTLAQANADAARMIPIWLTTWPTPPGLDRQLFVNLQLTPTFLPLASSVVGDVGRGLWILMGTIGIVLLIACANVANLLLARGESRQHEIAIRVALGARASRVAREWLLESLVLAALGGAMGLALAFGGVRLLVAFGPATMPRLNDVSIDPTVVAFTVIATLLAGLVFGTMPVARHIGARLAPTLRSGGRTASSSRDRQRVRSTLVVVQVALALVLLVASGLMIRTFVALRTVDPGFTDPAHVQLVRVRITTEIAKNEDAAVRALGDIRERLAAIPGAAAVSFTNSVPLTDSGGDAVFYENEATPSSQTLVRRFKFVAPMFFEAIGTPLVAGRDFTWADLYNHHPVALISENLAREKWRQPAAAIGKRIRENPQGLWREVVGVVGNVHDDGVDQPAPATVYWPVLMDSFWGNKVFASRVVTFTIRSSRAGSEGFVKEIGDAIWKVNASLPLAQVRTLGDLYTRSMARTSFTLVMLGIAATMALLLGVVGIYGVIAYAVTQRTREIGIRVALGAQRGEVKRMFIRQGVSLAAIGMICGLIAAACVTRLMSFLLFGIPPFDAVTYAVVSLVLIAASAAASYIPAHRAASVDPATTLRGD